MPRRYRVEITRAAERDVIRIYEYIERHSPEGALKWFVEIEQQAIDIVILNVKRGVDATGRIRQSGEHLLERGMIDDVVSRLELGNRVALLLEYLENRSNLERYT